MPVSLKDLPKQPTLPNPFAWANGKGEVRKFKDWEARRNEILAMIQHYEVGTKPTVSRDQMSANMSGDTLIVVFSNAGESLTLKATITYPDQTQFPAPSQGYPAVIGLGMPSGSLPRDIFATRGIAMIRYDFMQVTSHTQKRGNEPYNKIYPELQYVGSYSAWPWGVSRIIDGL